MYMVIFHSVHSNLWETDFNKSNHIYTQYYAVNQKKKKKKAFKQITSIRKE